VAKLSPDMHELVESISTKQAPHAEVEKLIQIFQNTMTEEEIILLDNLLTGSEIEIRELEDCIWELLALEDATESLISLQEEFMDGVIAPDFLELALEHTDRLFRTTEPEEAEIVIDSWLAILNLEWTSEN
jgi:hypothetical protein